MISQVLTNIKEVSFLCAIYEGFKEKIRQFWAGLMPDFLVEETISEQIPEGTVLTIAYKGLGFVLLTLKWYSDHNQI